MACCYTVSGNCTIKAWCPLAACLLPSARANQVFAALHDLAWHRTCKVPRLTEKQKEALRLFNAIALSDKLRIDFLLQPGDIQLLSNHTQLHTRSAFEDYEVIPAHIPAASSRCTTWQWPGDPKLLLMQPASHRVLPGCHGGN